MGKRDKRIDAYIARSADFAKPILRELREIVHEGCPDVEETLKWGMPSFTYKGILCGIAAFKNHCSFGFWKSSLILDKADQKVKEGMGSFGYITSMEDLPPRKKMLAYIKKAKQLNDDGVKISKPPVQKRDKSDLVVPSYLTAALKKNKKAAAQFAAFSYSKQKDYIEWLTEAKTEETRNRRLETTVEWVAEGKSRNWKYEKC